jgi:hypothetical protein
VFALDQVPKETNQTLHSGDQMKEQLCRRQKLTPTLCFGLCSLAVRPYQDQNDKFVEKKSRVTDT